VTAGAIELALDVEHATLELQDQELLAGEVPGPLRQSPVVVTALHRVGDRPSVRVVPGPLVVVQTGAEPLDRVPQ
jgi:hypothetical protein